MMKPSQKCFDLVKRFEGCKLAAYKCPAGVWTIGYGHTAGVKAGDVWTQAQAEAALESELTSFAVKVEKLLKVPVNQNRFDALVSLAYNIGVGALAGSTLLRKLNAADYMGAGAEFPKWNKAGGKVLKGLVLRRQAEQALYMEGV